ncbi:MAG: GGDEF domain-containing protein, partial [Dehalococcoidia bacterium]
MSRDWLHDAWSYHGYLAVAVLTTAAAAAVAGAFDLGARVAEWTGVPAGTYVAVLLPALLALAFVSVHAVSERRRRSSYEWDLIRTNLSLRETAAAMERQARSDALTGLDNRRSWYEKLEREWQRSERYGRPPAVIMLDLDNFKEINDDYGHAVGDELLVVVAETLRRNLRASDVIGRLGGDEFAVLLPEASAIAAQVVAEKMRCSVELSAAGAAVTASAGVASGSCEEIIDAHALLRSADRALYDAKAAGRNRVVLA